ncbi:MAG: type II secretion system secretin GspD [Hyphomicrobiales bacterium]
MTSALLLSACTTSLPGNDLLAEKLAPKPSKAARIAPPSAVLGADRTVSHFEGAYSTGTDKFVGVGDTQALQDEAGEDITLNLVNVPLPQAAKTVLGEVLELNYSVDGRVNGAVTLQTTKPISRSRLLSAFEAVLRDNGAAMVEQSGVYRIVPAQEATRTVASLETDEQEPGRPGLRSHVVSLNYVSASEMAGVLQSIVPEGMILKVDAGRNLLIVSGTDREITNLKDTIALFDVDWMRGMSFALVPVKTSSPQAIARELDTIFDTDKGLSKGMIRFVPNKRLNAVLVISSRAKYLRDASAWIAKLDTLAETNESRLHVYNVQNRTASELAKVLQSVYRTEAGGRVAVESAVAPKLEPVAVEAPAQGDVPDRTATTAPAPAGDDSGPVLSSDEQNAGVRLVADDSNNSLLVVSTDAEFERMLEVLQDIDSMPNQVLLEAVIAEVSLDDDLKFGVRWAFGGDNDSGTFSDANDGAVTSVFPGFSYFLKADGIKIALNAISSVTDVKVLSAPSLVVLDNRTAVLQVGDQVPIVTQQATSVDTPGAPLVSNVELKDTGVILSVTPRVNDSGRVILEIQQEVSSVVRTTTSGIDSPTIRQRKVKTSVVVSDGEALALGGLIQERETTNRSKVPILGDVPLLGNAFRSKGNAVNRTELIIFIRPRVIRDLSEARQVTEEFRRQLSIEAPRVRRGTPEPGDELMRIVR